MASMDLIRDHRMNTPVTDLPSSIRVEDVAQYLINQKFYLTALEMHQELLERSPSQRHDVHALHAFAARSDLFGGSVDLPVAPAPTDICIEWDVVQQHVHQIQVLEWKVRCLTDELKELREQLMATTAVPAMQSTDPPPSAKELRALDQSVAQYLHARTYKFTVSMLAEESHRKDLLDQEASHALLDLYRSEPKCGCDLKDCATMTIEERSRKGDMMDPALHTAEEQMSSIRSEKAKTMLTRVREPCRQDQQDELVKHLCDSLPQIAKKLPVAERGMLFPIIFSISRKQYLHDDARGMLVRLAMCLVPRPSLLEREMMIRNCIEVAVLVGPEQTQANILSPMAKYINSETVEKKLLILECCQSLIPFVTSSCQTSLCLAILETGMQEATLYLDDCSGKAPTYLPACINLLHQLLQTLSIEAFRLSCTRIEHLLLYYCRLMNRNDQDCILDCLVVKFPDTSCWISWINGLIESISILMQQVLDIDEGHTRCFLWIGEEEEGKWHHHYTQIQSLVHWLRWTIEKYTLVTTKKDQNSSFFASPYVTYEQCATALIQAMSGMKASLHWTRKILHDVISIVQSLVQAFPEQARSYGHTFFLQLIAGSPTIMSPVLTNVNLMQYQKLESQRACQIDFRILLPLFFVGMHSTLDTEYNFGQLLHNILLSSLSSHFCSNRTQYQEFMLAMREVFRHLLASRSSNEEGEIEHRPEKQLTRIFLHHIDSTQGATTDDLRKADSDSDSGWTEEKSLVIQYLFQALVSHSTHFSDVVLQLIPPVLLRIPTIATPSTTALVEDCVLSLAYGCLWIPPNDEWTLKQLDSNFHLIFYGLTNDEDASRHSDTDRLMYLALLHMKHAFVTSRVIERDSDSLLLHKMLDIAQDMVMLRKDHQKMTISNWTRQSAMIIQDLYNCYLTRTLHEKRASSTVPSRLFHCIQMLQKAEFLVNDDAVLEHTEEMVLSSHSDLVPSERPERRSSSRVQSFARTWKRPPFITASASASKASSVWKRATEKWKAPHAA